MLGFVYMLFLHCYSERLLSKVLYNHTLFYFSVLPNMDQQYQVKLTTVLFRAMTILTPVPLLLLV